MAKNNKKTGKDECCCWAWGIVVLIIGILYLAQDFGWISWWIVSWWTIVFLFIGIHKLFRHCNCRK